MTVKAYVLILISVLGLHSIAMGTILGANGNVVLKSAGVKLDPSGERCLHELLQEESREPYAKDTRVDHVEIYYNNELNRLEILVHFAKRYPQANVPMPLVFGKACSRDNE